MKKENIEIISNNIIIPESLKTENFDIITFLKLLPKNIFDNENKFLNNYSKILHFYYETELKNKNDLLKCVSFFKLFSKRSLNLIRFDYWDDDKIFDFMIKYKTKFYFTIPNLKNFCKKYKINFNSETINKEIKNVFLNNFLHI